jgi:hypothetical protein
VGDDLAGLYLAEINRAYPGCIVFLLDQSFSMKDPFAGNTAVRKANAAADAINKLLMDLVIRSTQNFGEGPRDYFDIGVIGYGARTGVGPCFGGSLKGRELVSISELAANLLRVEQRARTVSNEEGVHNTTVRFPVWFDPVAEGGTPMAEAMQVARKILEPWVAAHRKSSPPIVINITDGEPGSSPVKAAGALTALASDDGDVLLYNIHLSRLALTPITFPSSSANLPDKYATMLFDISSQVPPQIREELNVEGYPTDPGARGFVFNADAGALLQFLDIGTRLAMGGVASDR